MAEDLSLRFRTATPYLQGKILLDIQRRLDEIERYGLTGGGGGGSFSGGGGGGGALGGSGTPYNLAYWLAAGTLGSSQISQDAASNANLIGKFVNHFSFQTTGSAELIRMVIGPKFGIGTAGANYGGVPTTYLDIGGAVLPGLGVGVLPGQNFPGVIVRLSGPAYYALSDGTHAMYMGCDASGCTLQSFTDDPVTFKLFNGNYIMHTLTHTAYDGSTKALVMENGEPILWKDSVPSAFGGTASGIGVAVKSDNNIYITTKSGQSIIILNGPTGSVILNAASAISTLRSNFFYVATSTGGLLATFSAGSNYLDVTGPCHASSFPVSSDRRFKKNIKPIPHALDKVVALRGVYFDWNRNYQRLGRKGTKGRQVGLIAQDVEKVVPEVVQKWKQGKIKNYRSVDYDRLVPILIEGMKEQQRTIKRLARRVAKLEKHK